MTTSFADSLWPGVLLWAALYVSDFAFTLYCARLYETRVRRVIDCDGSYELNPAFQKEIDSGKWLSPRFLLALVLSSGFLAIIWDISRRPPAWPQGYDFLLGAMILLELAVHTRHVRNAISFRFWFSGDGVRGRIEYDRALVLRMSALDFHSFAVLFGILFLVTGSPFLLGGAISCAYTGFSQRRLARRHAQLGQNHPGEPKAHTDSPPDADA